MSALAWIRTQEANEFGTLCPTYRADLRDGTQVMIQRDGIPSWPYTIYWPVLQGEFFAKTLYTAKAEAQAYADHLDEVAAPTDKKEQASE